MKCDEGIWKGSAEPRGGQVDEREESRGLGPCYRLERNSIVMRVFKYIYVLLKLRKT